jgi:hypothetical protein
VFLKLIVSLNNKAASFSVEGLASELGTAQSINNPQQKQKGSVCLSS